MTKVIEFLKLLDGKDPAFGAMKLFTILGAALILCMLLSMVVGAWKVALGVCS